ncbi:MAG: hypothetical protein AAF721_34725 [Myxococcota bacterium]
MRASLRVAEPETLAVTLAADATLSYPFVFHALGDTTVVSTRNRVAPLFVEHTRLQWSAADISDALPEGHYGGMQFERVGGAWPRHVVGVLADSRPRSATVRKYVRWSGKTWNAWKAAPADRGIYVAFALRSDGRVLGLQHGDMWSGRIEDFEPRIDVFPAGEAPKVPAGYVPVSLATDSRGFLFAIASERDDHRARLLAWGPGGGDAAVVDLPEVAGFAPRAGDVRVIAGRDGKGVWIGGGVGEEDDAAWVPYLVRRADRKWLAWEAPDPLRGMVGSIGHRAERPGLWFTTSARHGPTNSRWVAGRGDVPLVGKLWRAGAAMDLHEVTVALDRKPDKAPPSGFGTRTIAFTGDRLWIAMEIDAEIVDMDWQTLPSHLLATAVIEPAP